MSRLAKPVKGTHYRRPTKDKPIRVIWDDDDGKTRRKAFGWVGPAAELANNCWRSNPSAEPIVVDVKRDKVARLENIWSRRLEPWRDPTPEEEARIVALKLTYEGRGRA